MCSSDLFPSHDMFHLEVYFLMALVVKGKVNINEFIDLSKSEKLLPSMFTPVRYLSKRLL